MGQKFSNNARSRLVGSLSSSATSFTVESATADLFPIANTTDWLTVNDWFKAVLEDSSGNIEIVHVGSRNSGSGLLTNVLRGQEGTTARTFNAGATVSLRLTAADFETALAKFENVTAFMLTLMDDADAAAARTTLGISTFGSDLIDSPDPAAARATIGAPAEEQGFQPGDIKWQAHTTVDTGWLAANGGAHSRTVYAALFARIGTTFGAGDGSTTFNVPDMRDRMAIGSGNLYALGAVGGSKDAIVVSHTHGINDPGHNHSINLGLDVASGTGFQKLLPGDGYSENTSGSGTGISIQSTGTSGTNANLPPYRALFAVIKY